MLWVRGNVSTPPGWAVDILYGEAFGISPHRLEQEVPHIWIERWLLLQNERAKAQDKRSGAGGQGTAKRADGTTVRTVI